MKSIDWSKGSGLVPAIVEDADSGRVLMLAYMNAESLEKTKTTGLVTFYSRSRQALWTKGETSGHHLNFVDMRVDCDGDTLLIRARPKGPVCHLGTKTCFGGSVEGSPDLDFLNVLARTITQRMTAAPGETDTPSYVAKLVSSGLDRMAQKVGEEAVETVIAAKNSDRAVLESEAADLLFHLMVLLQSQGSSLGRVTEVLKGRHR